MEQLLVYIPLLVICLSSIVYTVFKVIKIAVIKIKSYQSKTIREDELSVNFEALANKTKFKRLLFLVWLTIGYTTLLFGGAYYVNSRWMIQEYAKTSDTAQKYMNVNAPNINYTNMISKYDSPFSSHIQMDTYKNIDGYPVSWSPMTFDFGTLLVTNNSYLGSPTQINNGYYTQDTKQKIASFFLPKLNYKSENYHGLQPTHEAKSLVSEKNQLAEVAISFDKPYSYEEIQKMIPDNLLINWYWIGVNDDTNINANITPDYGLSSDEVSEDSDKDEYGKLSTDGYDYFVQNLKELNWGGVTSNDFDSRSDVLKQIKKYPTLDKAKFSGVILTGRTDNFINLDEKSWVFSSNVGVTTPIKSYIKPIK